MSRDAGLRIRRVVTGHDDALRAVVESDEILPITTSRPGQEGCAVWGDRVPADNLDPADGAERALVTNLEQGAVFRVVRYAPGASGRMHRTKTLDYGVVIEGAIVLELDGGVEVGLNAGDLLVQRGTIHRWINRGAVACTVAFVLLDALEVQGVER